MENSEESLCVFFKINFCYLMLCYFQRFVVIDIVCVDSVHVYTVNHVEAREKLSDCARRNDYRGVFRRLSGKP